jgi:molecular chaperone GrpE
MPHYLPGAMENVLTSVCRFIILCKTKARKGEVMLDGDKHAKNSDKKHPFHRDGGETTPNHPVEQTAAGDQTKADQPDTNAPSEEKKDSAEKSMTEKITALEAENADLKDKFLRKYADFENFKKRTNREREESAKYSNAMLLLDIVNTIDNFERAIKSAEDAKDFKNFHSGIALIEKQLVSILEKKWGLERFSAKGAPFDPERHEAIMSEQSPQAETTVVTEDFQSGYLLHGRVLRPAKVKVLQPHQETKSQHAPGGSDIPIEN